MPERETMNRAWRNQIWQSPEGGEGGAGKQRNYAWCNQLWQNLEEECRKEKEKRWRVA